MKQRTPLSQRAAVAVLATLALAACGGDDDTAPTSTTTTTAAAPASSAPATTTAVTEAPATSQAPAATTATTGATPTSAPATVAPTTVASGDVTPVADNPATDPWTRTAAEFRGQTGQQYEYTCPAGGDVLGASIWGTEIYTDDSAVCIAAVHVGLVNPEDGGAVTIVIEDGQADYESGTAHGVTSARYGEWAGSFSFPEAPVGTGTFEVSLDSWNYSISTFGLEEGQTVSVACAPDGPLDAVWGSGPYTGDSSICTAAVHAGVFAHEDGGAVTVVAGGEQESYEGSEANGVTTSDYGPYGPSFEIVPTPR